MNIKTGLDILNKSWLIEPKAAQQLFDFWSRVLTGEMTWDYNQAVNKEGATTYSIYKEFFEKQNIIMAPDSSWDMGEFKGFEGAQIAVIPVSGPIMKNDFCGSFGTNSLRQLTQKASDTPSVQAIIFLHDSPGGTVDGTEAFANTIKASTKRTISLIDGICCSADYWIASASDEVYANGNTNIIGCIGTMITLVDNAKAMENRGVVIREYYASESSDKNGAFNAAIRGEGKKLISELLDPLNDVFLKAVRGNRAGKLNTRSENPLTGKDYLPETAMKIGLIDGIKTFDQIVSEIESTRPAANRMYAGATNKNLTKNTKMTAAEFKTAHPAAYAEILAEGANAERDRVGTWMLHAGADLEAVTAGIDSGKPITGKQAHELMLKGFSKETVDQAKAENAPRLSPSATPGAGTKTEAELNKESILAQARKDMGIKK